MYMYVHVASLVSELLRLLVSANEYINCESLKRDLALILYLNQPSLMAFTSFVHTVYMYMFML